MCAENTTAARYRLASHNDGLWSGWACKLSVGRIGAILGPFIAGALQQIYQGPTAMFVAIGCASIVAGAPIASLSSPSRVANLAALEGSRV